MKVFRQSGRLLNLFNVTEPNYGNKWIDRGCRLYAIVYVTMSLLAGWSSVLFFSKSLSINKEDAFCALYQLVVVVGPLTTFILAQFLKKDIAENFDDYQNFYDKYKDMDPLGFMKKAEKSGRRIVKIYSWGFGSAALFSNVGSGVGSLFYNLYRHGTHINYTEVHKPYRYVLPWNQLNFNGWFWETVFSLFLPIHFFSSSSGYTTLLATSCEYHMAFCNIVNYHVTSIDDYVRSGTYRMADLRKMYHRTVSFHIEAKELFGKSDEIYCFLVAVELFHFMYFTTFILFHFDHAIRHLNLHFALMTVAFVYGISVLHLYCNYGQSVTESYAGISEHLYFSEWMNLPLCVQRMYVLMIAHAQQELHFRGAGMIELKRETFLRLFRTIIGYCLMFKTMAEGA